MSQALELQLTCPQCGTEFSRPAHTAVDMADEADSEALWQLQNGTLNRVECPNCSSAGIIPVPVILHIPKEEILMVFVPGVQEMGEEQLTQTIGPLMQNFLTNLVGEEGEPDEYMLHPIVTDDPTALQAAARGEISGSDLLGDGEYLMVDEDELEGDSQMPDDDEEEEEELSPEEQQALMERMNLLQRLLQASDSLERISFMRASKNLVDETFVEVIGLISEQAEDQNQPQLVEQLKKIMNEAEVFISSNQS